jgi:hypothetical protein
MAINARGQYMRLLLPEFSPDHLAVNDLDLCVTFRTGIRDIAP